MNIFKVLKKIGNGLVGAIAGLVGSIGYSSISILLFSGVGFICSLGALGGMAWLGIVNPEGVLTIMAGGTLFGSAVGTLTNLPVILSSPVLGFLEGYHNGLIAGLKSSVTLNNTIEAKKVAIARAANHELNTLGDGKQLLEKLQINIQSKFEAIIDSYTKLTANPVVENRPNTTVIVQELQTPQGTSSTARILDKTSSGVLPQIVSSPSAPVTESKNSPKLISVAVVNQSETNALATDEAYTPSRLRA